MNTIHTASANELISTLDLGAIKTKLMHVESGEGWSSDHADAVEVEYRRFLTLMKLYPNDSTAPLVDIDTFWHYHILDTAKYAGDCEQAFGYFLHHYPYLGMDGAEDAATRDMAGARMAELYAATFGASMQAAPAAWCGAAAPQSTSATAWCGAATAQPAVAWCGAAAPAAAATAWCGAAAPKQTTAWCGAATAKQATAWCGAATSKQATAWCGAATSKQATAWCGAATSKQATAWCGAATSKQATAWCGAATSIQATAWCGAAHPVSLQVRDDITLTAMQAA